MINPVDDDSLGDADETHRAVWNRFAEIFRADLHPEVNLFVPIDVDASGGTDGAMQVEIRAEARTALGVE